MSARNSSYSIEAHPTMELPKALCFFPLLFCVCTYDCVTELKSLKFVDDITVIGLITDGAEDV